MHSPSWFPLLHRWKILQWIARHSLWLNQLNIFTVFCTYVPYDIFEDGVRDWIQCSTLHYSTWARRRMLIHSCIYQSLYFNKVPDNFNSQVSKVIDFSTGAKGHWVSSTLSFWHVSHPIQLHVKSLKERWNHHGFHPSLRTLYIKSSLARRASELILTVGWKLLGLLSFYVSYLEIILTFKIRCAWKTRRS